MYSLNFTLVQPLPSCFKNLRFLTGKFDAVIKAYLLRPATKKVIDEFKLSTPNFLDFLFSNQWTLKPKVLLKAGSPVMTCVFALLPCSVCYHYFSPSIFKLDAPTYLMLQKPMSLCVLFSFPYHGQFGHFLICEMMAFAHPDLDTLEGNLLKEFRLYLKVSLQIVRL